MAYLHKVAHGLVRSKFDILTDSDELIGVKLFLIFEDQQRSGLVMRCKSQATTVGSNVSDVMVIKIQRKGKLGATEVELPKSQVVHLLAKSKAELLEDVKEWNLYEALTQFRIIVTFCLLCDIEEIFVDLSEVFQSTQLTPSTLEQQLEHTYDRLERMRSANGT